MCQCSNSVSIHTNSQYRYSMPPIIMCRFILNLRQIKPAGNSWIDNQSHSLRFVGNLGQSLQFGGNEDGEGGEDDDDIEFETAPAGADVSFSTTRATGPIEVTGMDEDLGHDYDTDLDVRLRELCSRCSGGVDADLLPH